MKPPVFDIDPVAFKTDPYPVYRNMRDQAPICYVPQLDAVLLTRRDDIFTCEKNIEVFSSHQPGGLMTVLMGENMMRKDGDAHMRERRMAFPSFSPKTVSEVWKRQFENAAGAILNELADQSGPVDLTKEYAMRLSGDVLRSITGLTQLTAIEMNQCSQAMIDGIANYAGDPDIEAACKQAVAKLDAAISERLADGPSKEDYSLVSVFAQAGLEEESIRSNVKLAISGGQNETRDALAGCAWALLAHPTERNKLETGDADWMQVFDEYCRWMAPIGMSPRRIAKPFEYEGVTFEPEQRAFLMFGSANRDDDCFEEPDRFNVSQDTSKSIAFGAGPHFCAGAWASRCVVAEVGLPMLFERFPDMQIADDKACRFDGWAFRGLLELPVELGRTA